MGSQHFSLPKSPLSYSFLGAEVGKGAFKQGNEQKRLSVLYRRAFHGQDTFFAGSIDRGPHGKSIFFLSGSSCIPEDAFLSGVFGSEKCWDSNPGTDQKTNLL